MIEEEGEINSCHTWDVMTVGLDGYPFHRLLTPNPEGYSPPISLSHSGNQLAFTDLYGLWLTATDSGATKCMIPRSPVASVYSIFRLSWSPDDKKIACLIYYFYADFRTALMIFTINEKEDVSDLFSIITDQEETLKKTAVLGAIDFSWYDSDTLVCATGDYYGSYSKPCDYWQLNVNTMAKTKISQENYGVAVQKNAPRIWADEYGAIRLRIRAGKETLVSRVNGNYPSLSPDGAQFVCEMHGTESSLVIANIDGSGIKKLVGPRKADSPYIPFWLPNGKIVFLCDGALYMVDPNGGGWRPLTASNGSRPVWSADGKGVLFTTIVDGRSEVRLVDPLTRRAHQVTNQAIIQYYKQHAVQVADRAVSPDGGYLACVEEDEPDTFRGYGRPQINLYDRKTGRRVSSCLSGVITDG